MNNHAFHHTAAAAAAILAAVGTAVTESYAATDGRRLAKPTTFRKAPPPAARSVVPEGCRPARVRAEIAAADLATASGALRACAESAGARSCSMQFEQVQRAFEADEEAGIEVSAACR